jgi:glucans biosynthesis protein
MRTCLLAVVTLCFLDDRPVLGEESGRFSYAALCAKARELAANDYKPETGPELPGYLKDLTYDDYQSIRFLSSQTPWQGEGLGFSFEFFHRGYIYKDPVRIHLLEQGEVHEFQFSTKQFNYGKQRFREEVPSGLHFAGLKVLYPLNTPGKQDEVAAFLGASYFRIIGAGQGYGASFRGLAIDTADPNGEEFPRFTDFWIDKPAAQDESARLFALLDSPSVTGAYRFVIQPGNSTRVDVEAHLFFRKAVKKLGVAPMTSMFLVGENRTSWVPDFRPEVHDSDGLLIQANPEEYLWRPLVNPQKQHVTTRFPGNALSGFGLLQRDRQYDHYQDLASRLELRPSLWVEPQKGWGTGTVELVEIPSPNEWNDNIVTYWVPEQGPVRGQELDFTYRLYACLRDPETCGVMRVEATRITPGRDNKPPRFVIDFTGTNVPPLEADSPVEGVVRTSCGNVRNLVTEKNAVSGGWRAFFDLADAEGKPADLRLFLRMGEKVLSETWVYHYQQP